MEIKKTLKQITHGELKEKIRKHDLYLKGLEKGEKLDLTDTDLTFIAFGKVNLKDADFSGSDLRNTVFSETNLFNANFETCNLEGAKFNYCEIAEAKFNKANLIHAEGLKFATCDTGMYKNSYVYYKDKDISPYDINDFHVFEKEENCKDNKIKF